MNEVTHKEMRQIVDIIQKFIDDQNIWGVECVYQTDRVIENAYSLIAQLCDIVGYKELEDEDND